MSVYSDCADSTHAVDLLNPAIRARIIVNLRYSLCVSLFALQGFNTPRQRWVAHKESCHGGFAGNSESG